MSPKLRNALIAGYALGALATFGHAWHAGHRLVAEVNPNKGAQAECATITALMSSAAWPLYWSVHFTGDAP